MAAGVVYHVETNPNVPYGLHVRIQHSSGYKSLYAHFSRTDVVIGQPVNAGQQIGLSGNTGNSSGPHLHLAFKKDGIIYVDKQGQSWPSNLINPWPLIKHLYQPTGKTIASGYVYDYLIEGSDGQGVSLSTNLNLRTGPGNTYPAVGQVEVRTICDITGNKQNSYYPVTSWIDAPTGSAKIGLHASADPGDLTEAEFQLFQTAKVECVKVLSAHSPQSISRLAIEHPNVPFIVRAFLDWGNRIISPQQFFDWTFPDVQRSVNAIGGGREVWIEIHNEPNLPSEGLGYSWADGFGFNNWLLQVLNLYKNALQGVFWLSPGLSPGFTAYRPFLADSMASALACDGVAIHTYWSNDYSMNQAIIDTADYYVSKFGNKALWISEASHNKPGVTPSQKGLQYLTFWNEMKKRPSVKGVTYFVASASNPAFGWGTGGSCETWLGTDIAGVVGSR